MMSIQITFYGDLLSLREISLGNPGHGLPCGVKVVIVVVKVRLAANSRIRVEAMGAVLLRADARHRTISPILFCDPVSRAGRSQVTMTGSATDHDRDEEQGREEGWSHAVETSIEQGIRSFCEESHFADRSVYWRRMTVSFWLSVCERTGLQGRCLWPHT